MSMPYDQYNVPILGSPKPMSAPDGQIDLYDSDILKIEKVLERINERAQGRRDYDTFDREMRERYYDAGYVVDIRWYHTNDPEVKIPEIQFVARVEKESGFDHDKMSHEVRADILGLGTGGTIKVTKDMMAKVAETERAHKNAHGVNDDGHSG